jgi:hypothetical protein
MTSKSPQLTLEHLQQLSSSVQAIIDENKATMDEVLSRRVQIETASILSKRLSTCRAVSHRDRVVDQEAEPPLQPFYSFSYQSTYPVTLAEAAKSLLEQHAKTETSLLEAQF